MDKTIEYAALGLGALYVLGKVNKNVGADVGQTISTQIGAALGSVPGGLFSGIGSAIGASGGAAYTSGQKAAQDWLPSIRLNIPGGYEMMPITGVPAALLGGAWV